MSFMMMFGSPGVSWSMSASVVAAWRPWAGVWSRAESAGSLQLMPASLPKDTKTAMVFMLVVGVEVCVVFHFSSFFATASHTRRPLPSPT